VTIAAADVEHALTFVLTPTEEGAGTVKCRACHLVFRDMFDAAVYGACAALDTDSCELDKDHCDAMEPGC
jgi:hypothetical protein